MFTMDPLKTDLFQAYYDARRNKRNTINQLRLDRTTPSTG
ncbi:hypothetical protein FACS189446_8520 [Bacteroidia bacterium]|nr:hypothetical protein FACS189446_8520 [Bacteroidia bacterium]